MDALQPVALSAWSLVTDPRSALLITLLVVAAVSDCRSYRIPNWLTGGGLLAGVVSSGFFADQPVQAVLLAFAGAAIGLGVLLPLWMLRLLGAGDVKLMAMAGAFLGVQGTLWGIVFVLATGGLLAIGYALFRHAASRMFGNVRQIVTTLAVASMTGTRPISVTGLRSAGRMPYGLSICVGVTAFLIVRQVAAA